MTRRIEAPAAPLHLNALTGRLPALIILFVMLYCLPAAVVRAQLPVDATDSAVQQEATTASLLSTESVQARQQQLAQDRSRLEAYIAQQATEPGEDLSILVRQLDRLQQLLERQSELARAQVEPVQADTTDKASVFALNALLEEQLANENLLREHRDNLATLKKRLDKAERQYEQEQQGEALPAGAEGGAAAAPMSEHELDLQILREEVNLATLEVRATAALVEGQGQLTARIDALNARLAQGAGDATDGLLDLSRASGELQRTLERTERVQETIELRLAAMQRRYSESPDANPELLQSVEALATTRDALRQQIALYSSTLERLRTQRQIWQSWDALFKSEKTSADLEQWRQEGKERLDDLAQEKIQQQSRVGNLQVRLEKLSAKLAALPGESKLRQILREQEETLRQLYITRLDEVRAIAADVRLTERFLSDVNRLAGGLTVDDYLSLAGESILKVWNYRITTVDEAPFTVGSLVIGLLLFSVGLWASRSAGRLVGHLAEHRLKLDAGAVQTMQTLTFYALLTGFTLLALQTVHFPLTGFAFLGGALAIGVGFGSQNVMNNFISGLILMLERPVRARDVVEVDGNHGTIQKIGARSTQIHATDGRHIIVPNSFFLESNVVNWTLSDDLIRTKVTVGVIYGSPTRLVEKLISDMVASEPLILKNPEPIVIFDAFADNSLNFDVHFWVRARSPMAVRRAESRVRFLIDDVFRENDLVIAFPQRDVHLDTVKPLDVRVLGPADDASNDEK